MGPLFFFLISQKKKTFPRVSVTYKRGSYCKWNRETPSGSLVSDNAAQRDPHLSKAGLSRSCWDFNFNFHFNCNGWLWCCRALEILSQHFSLWKATFAFKINGPGQENFTALWTKCCGAIRGTKGEQSFARQLIYWMPLGAPAPPWCVVLIIKR